VSTYVKAGDPPMLLVHGAADKTVSVAQSQKLYDLLQSKGVPSELLVLPDIDHSFIGKTPDATREAARAGLARTIVFIDAVIGPKKP
jgi:dipeptidyl aminopeptidase/acylaminoacyl peptidase